MRLFRVWSEAAVHDSLGEEDTLSDVRTVCKQLLVTSMELNKSDLGPNKIEHDFELNGVSYAVDSSRSKVSESPASTQWVHLKSTVSNKPTSQ